MSGYFSKDTIAIMAREIAPELERRLDAWLKSDMLPATKEYRELATYLWDNKAGMLRVLQSVADIKSNREADGVSQNPTEDGK